MNKIYFLDNYISENKNLEIGLAVVYGIGRKRSLNICRKLGLNPKTRFKNLNNEIINTLILHIKFTYTFGFHLKKLKKQNIETLINVRVYKGNRHFLGYLVRGQRSRNKRKRRHF
jgi:small subunit ribosomal protein S13